MSMDGPDYSATSKIESISWCVGLALPELIVTPTHAQIFMFSAVTWNRHRVHYDREAARREGLPDVVVQRGLVGNYLAQMLRRWLGRPDGIRTLEWRMLHSAVADVALLCRGRIAACSKGEELERAECTIDVSVANSGTCVARGRATVERSLMASVGHDR